MKNPTCFIPLHPNADQFVLPEKLDFPFFYEPTSIAVYAAEELQKTLTENNFSHNFGIENAERNGAIGKMFGVLIVQNKLGELGYLKAFSGKLAFKIGISSSLTIIITEFSCLLFFKKRRNKGECAPMRRHRHALRVLSSRVRAPSPRPRSRPPVATSTHV